MKYDPFNADPELRTYDPENPIGIGLACPDPSCFIVAVGDTKANAELELAFHVNAVHPKNASEYVGLYNLDNMADTLQTSDGYPITSAEQLNAEEHYHGRN